MSSYHEHPPPPRRYRAEVFRRGIRQIGARPAAEGGLLVTRSWFGAREFRVGGSTMYRTDDRVVLTSPDGQVALIPRDEREIREIVADLLARGCLEVPPPLHVPEARLRQERARALLDRWPVRVAAGVGSLAVVGAFALFSTARSAVTAAAIVVAAGEILWGGREDRRDPTAPDIPTSVATWSSGLVTLGAVAIVGAVLLPDVAGVAFLAVDGVCGASWARTRRWPRPASEAGGGHS